MKIVTNPKSTGTTRVNVLIAILQIILGVATSMVFGKVTQPLTRNSGLVTRTAMSFGTTMAASKTSEVIIRRKTDRYLPMIARAEERLEELRKQS